MPGDRKRGLSPKEVSAILLKMGYATSVLYSGKCKDGRELLTFRDRGRYVIVLIKGRKLCITVNMAEEDANFLLYEVIGMPRSEREDDTRSRDPGKACNLNPPHIKPRSRVQNFSERER